jgi:LysM repeat protein
VGIQSSSQLRHNWPPSSIVPQLRLYEELKPGRRLTESDRVIAFPYHRVKAERDNTWRVIPQSEKGEARSPGQARQASNRHFGRVGPKASCFENCRKFHLFQHQGRHYERDNLGPATPLGRGRLGERGQHEFRAGRAESVRLDLGMIKPHILAQFFPQIMHESGDFRSAVEEKPVVPVAVDKSR